MFSLVIVVLAALSLADAGDVLTLTDADFDSRLADHDLALVKFYAPWYAERTAYVLSLICDNYLGCCSFHQSPSPPQSTGWTCPPHFCQVFLRLMPIR